MGTFEDFNPQKLPNNQIDDRDENKSEDSK